jgi:hypothetical protein
MKRVGWDSEKNEWVPSIKVREGEFKTGYPIDPRDAITPESIARFGHPMGRRNPSDFDSEDPYHRVDDGHIVVNQYYRPVEVAQHDVQHQKAGRIWSSAASAKAADTG